MTATDDADRTGGHRPRARATVARELADVERYLTEVPPHNGGGRAHLEARRAALQRELAALAREDGVATAVVVLVIALVAAAVAGVWWWSSRPPAPDQAATAFVEAWDAGDPGDGPVDGSSGEVSASWASIREGMDGAPVAVTLEGVAEDGEDATRATAEVTLSWSLPGAGSWTYASSAPLVRGDDGWRVAWSPSVAHPGLEEDAVLRVRRTTPPRADVLAEDGTALVTARPVVRVGIQPSRVVELPVTVAAVRDVLELELDDLPDRVEAADPDRFVPVVTLREEDYEAVRDQLQPIPGTVFQRDEQQLAPTRSFARATLGQVGPVTAELVEERPDRYQAGDVAGLSGLQRAYDEQLAGRPGIEILAAPEGDGEPTTLFAVAPEPGTPVTVTLDADVQRAADEALAGREDLPTALVAVRVGDGHVLAVANGPGAEGLDLALTGRYAPGSTFKIVTTAALLEGGLTPDDAVPCPATATVDGRAFSNAEDQALGDVPFRTAVANSCNTAFVELSRDLPPDALRDAAAAFGLGREPPLGVPAFGGDVPATEGGTDLAAAAIGQGRVLASPYAMADVAAAAARGAALAPSLVLEPDAAPSPTPEPLPGVVAAELPDLLRAVVTDGSGSAVADVPGAPVHGKTGTAEYGDQVPPRTHAWFVGWQGDVAFAVLVAETEDAFGGQVAAPIAADFLRRLAEDDAS